MKIEERIAIYNDFTVNKDKSNYSGENILIFLKQIYDPKSERNYDWVFATNVEETLLENVVVTYKKRWRIETQFRVQDEARIKCKSKEMKVRYFYFCLSKCFKQSGFVFTKMKQALKSF